MAEVGIKEAVILLGVAESTLRRWIKQGRIDARQEETPQGYVWIVNIPDAELLKGQAHVAEGEVGALREMNALLQLELHRRDQQLAEKDKQIEQLHILLKHAQERMLPIPSEHRGHQAWWRRLFSAS